jgi:hypothetical protein
MVSCRARVRGIYMADGRAHRVDISGTHSAILSRIRDRETMAQSFFSHHSPNCIALLVLSQYFCQFIIATVTTSLYRPLPRHQLLSCATMNW